MTGGQLLMADAAAANRRRSLVVDGVPRVHFCCRRSSSLLRRMGSFLLGVVTVLSVSFSPLSADATSSSAKVNDRFVLPPCSSRVQTHSQASVGVPYSTSDETEVGILSCCSPVTGDCVAAEDITCRAIDASGHTQDIVQSSLCYNVALPDCDCDSFATNGLSPAWCQSDGQCFAPLELPHLHSPGSTTLGCFKSEEACKADYVTMAAESQPPSTEQPSNDGVAAQQPQPDDIQSFSKDEIIDAAVGHGDGDGGNPAHENSGWFFELYCPEHPHTSVREPSFRAKSESCEAAALDHCRHKKLTKLICFARVLWMCQLFCPAA